jgi:hypothetical protein
MAAAITPDKWVSLLGDYGPMALFVFMVFVLWQIASRNKGLTVQQKKIQAVALSGVWLSIFILAAMIVVVYFRTRFPSEFQIRGYIHNLEDPSTITTRDNLFLKVKYGAYKDFDYEWRIITPQRMEGRVAFLLQKGAADHNPYRYEIPIRSDFYHGVVDITYDPASGKMKLVHGSEEETLEPKIEEAALPLRPIEKRFWADIVYASGPQSQLDPALLVGALDANDPIIRQNARAQLITMASKSAPALEHVFLDVSSSSRLRLEALRTLNGSSSLQNKDFSREAKCAIAKLADDPDESVRDQVSQLASKKLISTPGCPEKMSKRSTGTILVNLFDGSRMPMFDGIQVLMRVLDGDQKEIFSGFVKSPNVILKGLPLKNNSSDNFTVTVSAQGFLKAGITPIHVSQQVGGVADLMLVPQNNSFHFADWKQIKETRPQLWALLTSSAPDGTAQKRYEELMETRPAALAEFLTLATAMGTIYLPKDNALAYLKQLFWDEMAQDRFFAYADPSLLDQVRHAAKQGVLAEQINPGVFHPGATSSFKEIRASEAGLEMIFHENDKRVINGIDCIKVEVDMDYWNDPTAHILVQSNVGRGESINPTLVYMVRWMGGRRAGVPEFDPPYTIN